MENKASSLDGFWTVEFSQVGGGTNGGVVAIKDGRVYGGDNGYYYTGALHESGGNVEGELEIAHHHGAFETAFGIRASRFQIRVKAARRGQSIIGNISMIGVNGPSLAVALKKRTDLN